LGWDLNVQQGFLKIDNEVQCFSSHGWSIDPCIRENVNMIIVNPFTCT
jgi:hypothetical protein